MHWRRRKRGRDGKRGREERGAEGKAREGERRGREGRRGRGRERLFLVFSFGVEVNSLASISQR